MLGYPGPWSLPRAQHTRQSPLLPPKFSITQPSLLMTSICVHMCTLASQGTMYTCIYTNIVTHFKHPTRSETQAYMCTNHPCSHIPGFSTKPGPPKPGPPAQRLQGCPVEQVTSEPQGPQGGEESLAPGACSTPSSVQCPDPGRGAPAPRMM